MGNEPEQERINALLDRVARGVLTEAESEELALYTVERPELRAEVATRARRADLGAGWLARVEADQQIARLETARPVRIERGVGLALMVGGALALPFAPAAGPAIAVLGLLVLVASFVRVRLATLKNDPYKDVQQ
jgi:hypothetical protein